VSGTARSETIGLPAYYWVIGLRDWDMGSVYKDPTGSVDDLSNTVPAPGAWNMTQDRLWDYDWNTDTHTDQDPNKLEDGWGIAVIDTIYYGKLDSAGTNIDIDTTKGVGGAYWSNLADPDNELVGMFYGLEDKTVTVDADGSQVTEGVNFQFKIWQQDQGEYASFGGDGQGSAGRLGFDEYLGVGYEAAGDPIDSAVLWMSGTSAGNVGFLPPFATNDNEWQTVFQPDKTLGNGKVVVWADVTGGAVEPSITAVDPFFDSGRSEAHVHLNMVTTAQNFLNEPGGDDWTAQSNDDVVGASIPEPMTVLSIGFAVAGLGGYIRRRRRA